jgi:hypothetical protein
MWLLLIAIAAICNAISDTLQHHFGVSVFRNLDENQWNPVHSWDNKYTDKWWVPDALTDWFHRFKMAWIILLMSAIVFYDPVFPQWWINLPAAGTVWNLTFSLFYGKLLITKKKL